MAHKQESVDIVVGSPDPSKSEGEASSVQARQRKVKQALSSLGMDVAEDSAPPVIAVMGSGGGVRAMIGLLGTLVKLSEVKLLDVVTYLCGVSGSTWCMSSLCHDKMWSDLSYLENMENSISSRLRSSWNWRKGWSKVKETFLADLYSLTNIWAYIVVNAMIKEINEKNLSSHKDGCEGGENPYPIYSAVQKECLAKNDPGAWFEFTPHLSGFPAYGCFVKTELLGSEFEAGKLLKKNPECELCYLDGLWGSALANNEAMHDQLKNVFHNIINRSGGVPERNIIKIIEEEEIKQDPNCDCKGCDKIRKLLLQDLSDIPAEQKQAIWHGLAEAFEEAMKNPEEESDIDCPCPAGICRDFNILKHTLACLNQWKWGTMNNFLYKWEGDIPNTIFGKQHISLIDAGLEINTAFPLMLPPHRKVDLILSFDFSEGDPFQTLKKAAAYCEKNGIPFPKINLEDHDIPSKSCYIFEGADTGAPDVMHFPLFNEQTCEGNIEELRKKYATVKPSYDETMFKELIDVAKKNVAAGKESILKKINELVEKRKTA